LAIKITENINNGKRDIPPTYSGGSNAKLAKDMDPRNSTSTVLGLAVKLQTTRAQNIKAA
jgi:hypothetical protein